VIASVYAGAREQGGEWGGTGLGHRGVCLWGDTALSSKAGHEEDEDEEEEEEAAVARARGGAFHSLS
jgi:hypothetical protein